MKIKFPNAVFVLVCILLNTPIEVNNNLCQQCWFRQSSSVHNIADVCFVKPTCSCAVCEIFSLYINYLCLGIGAEPLLFICVPSKDNAHENHEKFLLRSNVYVCVYM